MRAEGIAEFRTAKGTLYLDRAFERDQPHYALHRRERHGAVAAWAEQETAGVLALLGRAMRSRQPGAFEETALAERSRRTSWLAERSADRWGGSDKIALQGITPRALDGVSLLGGRVVLPAGDWWSIHVTIEQLLGGPNACTVRTIGEQLAAPRAWPTR